MSQRYFGRPLAGEEPADLGLAACAVVATAGGVLLASAIDPSVLRDDWWRSVAALLLAPLLTAVVFGAADGRRLLGLMRRSEAAGSVTTAEPGAPRRHDGTTAALWTVMVGGAVLGACLLGIGPFAVAIGAAIAGKEVGRGFAQRLVRRYERRLGRRYFRTVGEPEKVVWLTASGLD